MPQKRRGKTKKPHSSSRLNQPARRADAGKTTAARHLSQLTFGHASLQSQHLSTLQRQQLVSQIGFALGNRHLQNIVADIQRNAPAQQQERGPSAALDLLVPDFYLELPTSVLNRAQAHIDANEKQEAIDALATELNSRRIIDLSFLDNQQITYNNSLAGSAGGRTRTTWRQVGREAWEREKIEVYLGDRVMRDANFLYSALMHEWQHVRQVFQRSEPGGRVEELLSELDAYCWQVEHAEPMGIYNRYHMSTLRDSLQFIVWIPLTHPDIWDTFSEETQAQLRGRYENAMELIANAPAQ